MLMWDRRLVVALTGRNQTIKELPAEHRLLEESRSAPWGRAAAINPDNVDLPIGGLATLPGPCGERSTAGVLPPRLAQDSSQDGSMRDRPAGHRLVRRGASRGSARGFNLRFAGPVCLCCYDTALRLGRRADVERLVLSLLGRSGMPQRRPRASGRVRSLCGRAWRPTS